MPQGVLAGTAPTHFVTNFLSADSLSFVSRTPKLSVLPFLLLTGKEEFYTFVSGWMSELLTSCREDVTTLIEGVKEVFLTQGNRLRRSLINYVFIIEVSGLWVRG